MKLEMIKRKNNLLIKFESNKGIEYEGVIKPK